jgi:hypothetical protein
MPFGHEWGTKDGTQGPSKVLSQQGLHCSCLRTSEQRSLWDPSCGMFGPPQSWSRRLLM